MPEFTQLVGWAPTVEEVPPSPITGMEPGKAIVLVDKNTGDRIIYAMSTENMDKYAEEILKGPSADSKVVLPNGADVSAVAQSRDG